MEKTAAVKESEPELFVFPPPPSKDAIEWEGAPLGLSNSITRTKTRTQVHDKTLDKDPAKRDRLIRTAQEFARSQPPGKTFEHEVIIHGIKVKAVTNSNHLIDFWLDNWYSVEEWKKHTGQEVMGEPRIMVYALTGVGAEPEAAYYSRQKNTIVFFNTAYYGQLKSWVLGAVGRILAEEFGIHSVHGACVAAHGKGILYIAPTGTGKSTSSYGLMELKDSRFHSDDWVYIRYVYQTKSGQEVGPAQIISSKGEKVEGFLVYQWLEKNSDDKNAKFWGWDLESNKVEGTVGELDLSQGIKAYAYISEKRFYLRTNLVESFSRTAYPLLSSKLENVPEVTEEFLKKNQSLLDTILTELRENEDPKAVSCFKAQSDQQIQKMIARLYAFDNSRAMLNIVDLFGKEKVFLNPLEPLKLSCVFLLRRDIGDDKVLDHLPLDQFMEKLLKGLTPDGKMEVAYNAYRAVDDQEERQFLNRVEEECKSNPDKSFYQIYADKKDKPYTLYQEFELFRMMWKAVRTYTMNTILTQDPKVKNKREAVLRTIKLISQVAKIEQEIHLDLQNYNQFLK